MKGSPSDSTGAMLAEAFSPKRERRLRRVYKLGPPFGPPVMKHKLFNRNQLQTAERRRLPRRLVLSGRKRPFKPKPSILSARRKAMKAERPRSGPLLLFFDVHARFERFHYFSQY